MKLIKVLAASIMAVSLMTVAVNAADAKPKGKIAPCCAKAKKKGEECTHACCVKAKKEGKNCEKCGGKNE